MNTEVTPKKILVAEDEEQLATFYSTILKDAGYVVDIAQNGNEVIDLVSKGNVYDLLVLDIRMPFKDGWQVLTDLGTQNYRQNVKHILIFTNNFLEPNREIELISMGVDGYFVKSEVEPVKFLHSVNKYINS